MSTYLDYYNEKIAPKLRAIDLFFKTEDMNTYTLEIFSNLLDITASEVEDIMQKFDLNEVNKLSFFTVMQYGSSDICRLFSREMQRKSPYFYTYYDISYIYEIPYDVIVEAANKAKIKAITQDTINTLFSNISLVGEKISVS